MGTSQHAPLSAVVVGLQGSNSALWVDGRLQVAKISVPQAYATLNNDRVSGLARSHTACWLFNHVHVHSRETLPPNIWHIAMSVCVVPQHGSCCMPCASLSGAGAPSTPSSSCSQLALPRTTTTTASSPRLSTSARGGERVELIVIKGCSSPAHVCSVHTTTLHTLTRVRCSKPPPPPLPPAGTSSFLRRGPRLHFRDSMLANPPTPPHRLRANWPIGTFPARACTNPC